jgi:hypothetical protein
MEDRIVKDLSLDMRSGFTWTLLLSCGHEVVWPYPEPPEKETRVQCKVCIEAEERRTYKVKVRG